MKHFDEKTIELYLLGSEKVADVQQEIRLHLEECASCREMYAELQEFFEAIQGAQPALDQATKALPSASLVVRPEYRDLQPPIRVRRSIPARVWRLAVQRPIAASFTTVAFFAVCAVLTISLIKKRDTNPLIVFPNDATSSIDFLNRQNERLWSLPVIGGREKWGTSIWHMNPIQIGDINGDGRNEIVTILPILTPKKSERDILRAFDGTGKLIWSIEDTVSHVTFRDTYYDAPYCYNAVELVSPTDHQFTIVAGCQNGRSPYRIVRFDRNGNILGEYRHYGQLASMASIDINDDGSPELLLTGISDLDDQRNLFRAVVIVLDPQKISGITESSATRGFGVPVSEAERFYLWLPYSDMDKAVNKHGLARIRSIDKKGTVSVGTMISAELHAFEFFFDSSMHVSQVKYDHQTPTVHARLRREGKITSTFNSAFLENLRKNVQYWNGTAWQSQWSKVKH